MSLINWNYTVGRIGYNGPTHTPPTKDAFCLEIHSIPECDNIESKLDAEIPTYEKTVLVYYDTANHTLTDLVIADNQGRSIDFGKMSGNYIFIYRNLFGDDEVWTTRG
jgi:hypothetical protein